MTLTFFTDSCTLYAVHSKQCDCLELIVSVKYGDYAVRTEANVYWCHLYAPVAIVLHENKSADIMRRNDLLRIIVSLLICGGLRNVFRDKRRKLSVGLGWQYKEQNLEDRDRKCQC